MTQPAPKSFLIVSSLLIMMFSSCKYDVKKSNTELLFDSIDSHWNSPNDSVRQALMSELSTYNLDNLDSSYQKAFWYNSYNLFLEDMSHHPSGYVDFNRFLRTELKIANEHLTTRELIQKLETFKDPRVLICLDFYTTTSSPTCRHALHKNGEAGLDSLCSQIINNPKFIRVKKEADVVYYPEHFDWHTTRTEAQTSSRDLILKYHQNRNVIRNYRFKPYPFSAKLRN